MDQFLPPGHLRVIPVPAEHQRSPSESSARSVPTVSDRDEAGGPGRGLDDMVQQVDDLVQQVDDLVSSARSSLHPS